MRSGIYVAVALVLSCAAAIALLAPTHATGAQRHGPHAGPVLSLNGTGPANTTNSTTTSSTTSATSSSSSSTTATTSAPTTSTTSTTTTSTATTTAPANQVLNSTPIPPTPPGRAGQNSTALAGIEAARSRFGSAIISIQAAQPSRQPANNSSAPGPLYLSYQQMSNATSVSGSDIAAIRSMLSGPGLLSFNESITAPYGTVMQSGRYAAAGAMLHFVAYNSNDVVTYYNVSIAKATPGVSIRVNGASVTTPGPAQEIHIPILPGQKSYTLSLGLSSYIPTGNRLQYSYAIRFSNGTSITGSPFSNGFSTGYYFTIPVNRSLTVTFDAHGNPNYTSVDPTANIIPTNILFYVPITLTNSQATATPTPWQQQVPVNSLAYQSYEANTLDNIEFFYSNGTIVPSWLEGSASSYNFNNPTNAVNLYTSTNTIYWLNVSQGIPGSGSVVVYMGFANTLTNVLNAANTGEMPDLSSTVDQYDDGSAVFLFYDNGQTTSTLNLVNGGSLSTATETDPYGVSDTVITLTGSGSTSTSGETIAWAKTAAGANIIGEGWADIASSDTTTHQANACFDTRGSGDTVLTNYIECDGWTGKESALYYLSGTTATSIAVSSTARAAGWWWLYAYIDGSSLYQATYSATYGTLESSASGTSTTLGTSDTYFGISDWAGEAGPAWFYWFRARYYPPGGAMPSASFGSVYGVATFTENGLPNSGEHWSVTYNGVTTNAVVPNSISFSVAAGSYSFSVPSVTVGSNTYNPSPSSGTLVAGNATTIQFTQVVSTCQISLSANSISFGTLNPGASHPTNVVVTDTNGGTLNSFMYVYGGNWISGATNFGVSNTLWSSTSQSSYTGTQLSATASNTAILVASSSGSNSIYFGLGIPVGQQALTYNQVITIENVC